MVQTNNIFFKMSFDDDECFDDDEYLEIFDGNKQTHNNIVNKLQTDVFLNFDWTFALASAHPGFARVSSS